MSEKAYGQSQDGNVYVFEVPKSANKLSVAEAVEAQFSVTVERVNTTNIQGKVKRTFTNKRGKSTRGQRSDIKKAYVTLKEGDIIPVFAAEQEAEAKQEKLEKVMEKAEAKRAKKEAKESK
jgi:large subunit ribosomal protein L23